MPILAMLLLSLVGRVPVRCFLMSLGLFGLYFFQYVWLWMPTHPAPLSPETEKALGSPPPEGPFVFVAQLY